MKKQVIASLLAATLVGSANAKVNITGKYYVKIDNSSIIKQELDLSIKATAGKSVVVTSLDLDDKAGTGIPSNFTVSEAYLKTKIAGIRVNAGTAKGQKGKGLTYKKEASTRVKLSKRLNGFTTTLTSGSGNSNLTVDVSGKVAGLRVNVQNALNDGRTTSISGSKNGFSGLIEHNEETTAYKLSADVAGLTASFVKIDADAGVVTQNNGVFGDITGATDVQGVILSTKTSFGTLTGKFYDVDGASTKKATLSTGGFDYTVSKTGSSDATIEAKYSLKF